MKQAIKSKHYKICSRCGSHQLQNKIKLCLVCGEKLK